VIAFRCWWRPPPLRRLRTVERSLPVPYRAGCCSTLRPFGIYRFPLFSLFGGPSWFGYTPHTAFQLVWQTLPLFHTTLDGGLDGPLTCHHHRGRAYGLGDGRRRSRERPQRTVTFTVRWWWDFSHRLPPPDGWCIPAGTGYTFRGWFELGGGTNFYLPTTLHLPGRR